MKSMRNTLKRSILSMSVLAIIFSSLFLPVSAATAANWKHIEYTGLVSTSSSGSWISEEIGNGVALQNPQTNKAHYVDGQWDVHIKHGTCSRINLKIDGISVSNRDVAIKLKRSGTEINGTKYEENRYSINNVRNYISSGKSRHTIAFTTFNGTQSSVNYLHVYPLIPGPAPSDVNYSELTHHITGLDSNMEFSFDNGADWYYFKSGTNISYNIYPRLSTSKSTNIAVRYSAAQTGIASNSWTYTVSRLEPAPTGLSIGWYKGNAALFGLDSTKYYAISNTASFASFAQIGPGYNAGLLDAAMKPGDTVYVRSAADANDWSPSSACVAVKAPAYPVPNVKYDNTTHYLTGLTSEMDLRLTVSGNVTDWLQVPADTNVLNLYPFLNTTDNQKVELRYRDTPTAVQSIAVPALSPPPLDLSLVWVDGTGLVLWGLQNGCRYNLWTDASFDDWYNVDATSMGLSLDSLGLQPGNSIFVRYAPDSTSAQSACIEMIVPPLAAASAPAARSANITESAESVVSDIPALGAQITSKPAGKAFALSEAKSAADVSADNTQESAVVNTEYAFGEVKEYVAESEAEPVISTVSDSM